MTNEQQKTWLDVEAEKFKQHATYEELPSLKLQPNVVAELVIDFSKPFQEWNGEQNGKTITKKIIPITFSGQKMNWWLNVKNPIYQDVIKAGKSGQNTIKVLQTGTQANTKYVLVK
jgi:hypothetical protein